MFRAIKNSYDYKNFVIVEDKRSITIGSGSGLFIIELIKFYYKRNLAKVLAQYYHNMFRDTISDHKLIMKYFPNLDLIVLNKCFNRHLSKLKASNASMHY